MAKNIYVGNLSWSVTNEDLLEMFGPYGKVRSAQVISDRETGRSRGFGFVEMENEEEAQKAIEALNGTTHQNRELTVNIAVGSSRVDLQACKLEYSIVSPK